MVVIKLPSCCSSVSPVKPRCSSNAYRCIGRRSVLARIQHHRCFIRFHGGIIYFAASVVALTRLKPKATSAGLSNVSNMENFSVAFTACGRFGGMCRRSPAFIQCGLPSRRSSSVSWSGGLHCDAGAAGRERNSRLVFDTRLA